VRKCIREFQDISLEDTLILLRSQYHEARLLALLLLVARYGNAQTPADQRKVYRAYLDHTAYINNWDLVDCSAPHIAGAYLFSRKRAPLYKLAGSHSLWERRIAVLSTFYFIRKSDYADTLAISKLLLLDSEDLIHKAVGWMLREVGKRNRQAEEDFLLQHYRAMPRTMLRYAIERFPEADRQGYLKGTK
jgi:3-methyladenine DNA glycosylase AlkD